MLGTMEMVIIAGAIGFFCFGPKFIKGLGTATAESIREFRGLKDEFKDEPKAKKGN